MIDPVSLGSPPAQPRSDRDRAVDAWRDETIRLGEEIFERDVRPTLPPDPPDDAIVIDVDGGGWEIDADPVAAHKRLFAKAPNARGYVRRLVSRSFGTMR